MFHCGWYLMMGSGLRGLRRAQRFRWLMWSIKGFRAKSKLLKNTTERLSHHQIDLQIFTSSCGSAESFISDQKQVRQRLQQALHDVTNKRMWSVNVRAIYCESRMSTVWTHWFVFSLHKSHRDQSREQRITFKFLFYWGILWDIVLLYIFFKGLTLLNNVSLLFPSFHFYNRQSHNCSVSTGPT